MAAHAKLGPSGADRWMVCTASVDYVDRLAAEGRVARDETSEWAAEGTVAHSVREDCLIFGLDPHQFVGEVRSADGFTFTVTDDMAEHLLPGIDWIRQHTGNPHVEVRVDLSPWLPEQFGTCDTGWVEGDTLYVSDLKYGMGVPVDAVGNRQIRLYALGLWHFLGRPDVDQVVLMIDQPRAGGLKFWDITMDDLLAFGTEVKGVYAKLQSGDVEFVPGEKQCKWCPAKDICAARDEWMLSMFQGAFDEVSDDEPTFKDPAAVEPKKRWYIVKHAALARAWLARLHEESLAAAYAGSPDPGSKAVIGDKGNRYLTDPEKAKDILVKALGDEAFKPREIIPLTTAEKLLKPGKKKTGHPDEWADLLKLVDQPAGKPTLVPESDPRPAVKSVDDSFDEVETDDL